MFCLVVSSTKSYYILMVWIKVMKETNVKAMARKKKKKWRKHARPKMDLTSVRQLETVKNQKLCRSPWVEVWTCSVFVPGRLLS